MEQSTNDPVVLFERWFAEAKQSEPRFPEAASLATVTPDGSPRNRMVLVKEFDESGFRFYTNRESDKGLELAANPKASLCFYWGSLDRQVRIEGEVFELGDEESDAYWRTRPRGNRLAAWASEQSRPIESRAAMDARLSEVNERFAGVDPPRPPHWGGYRLAAQRIEFWQGQQARFHDRWRFERRRDGAGWTRTRLQP